MLLDKLLPTYERPLFYKTLENKEEMLSACKLFVNNSRWHFIDLSRFFASLFKDVAKISSSSGHKKNLAQFHVKTWACKRRKHVAKSIAMEYRIVYKNIVSCNFCDYKTPPRSLAYANI